MTFTHVTSLVPLLVLAFYLIESVIRGIQSTDANKVRAFKESVLSDEGEEDRFMLYNLLIEKLEKELDETEDIMRVEAIKDNLLALKRSKETLTEGSQKDKDIVVKAVNRAVRNKQISTGIFVFLSRLITNIGFIVLFLTGSWIGILISMFTFVGYATIAEKTLTTTPGFQEFNNPRLMTTIYSLISSGFSHMPLFLALFMWRL